MARAGGTFESSFVDARALEGATTALIAAITVAKWLPVLAIGGAAQTALLIGFPARVRIRRPAVTIFALAIGFAAGFGPGLAKRLATGFPE